MSVTVRREGRPPLPHHLVRVEKFKHRVAAVLSNSQLAALVFQGLERRGVSAEQAREMS